MLGSAAYQLGQMIGTLIGLALFAGIVIGIVRLVQRGLGRNQTAAPPPGQQPLYPPPPGSPMGAPVGWDGRPPGSPTYGPPPGQVWPATPPAARGPAPVPRRTVKVLPLVGAAALVLLLIGWIAVSLGDDNTSTHKDRTAGFSIAIPDDWTEMDLSEEGMAEAFAPASPDIAYDPRLGSMSPEGQSLVVVRYISPDLQPQDADEIFASHEEEFRSNHAETAVERHEIDGHPAMRVTFELPNGVQAVQEWILLPGEELVVSGIAPAGISLDPAVAVVDSLELD